MSDLRVMEKPDQRARAVALAALGIVYGDIGTSPIYAMRECFHGPHGIAATPAHVLGVLSLIVWSLIVVISIKYLTFILRADNQGEGGILALMALVVTPNGNGRGRAMLVTIGLFGAALLYGDGIITPAISVLSAVEGLRIATPVFEPFVIPLTIGILFGLFSIQSRGTGRVGTFFGPVIFLWFVSLAVLGLASIVSTPHVLTAFNPVHAVRFFAEGGWAGFVVLGSVFLVVTGGEALYADMGHFGRSPIRRVWFAIVLPALLLNYFGQGALLIRNPEFAAHPFYHLAPRWALYGLVTLATAATVIASQAVITGSFSLTWQAIQLGYLPRLEIRHTSREEVGQVFIPAINTLLLVSTVAVVVGFRTSSNLAAAYGLAVTATMVITTMLAFLVMRRLWGWSALAAGAVTTIFVAIEIGFLASNLIKFVDGGWFSVCIGLGILAMMTTWQRGRRILAERLKEKAITFDKLDEWLAAGPPARIPGTAVYLTGDLAGMPPALRRTVRHLKIVHERVVLLRVETVRRPFVPNAERVEVHEIRPSVYGVTARYGFMEMPNVPRIVEQCKQHGLTIDDPTYVLSRETLLATERPGMAIWREKLFAIMSRNAGPATEFFRLPADRVIEIGAQIEL